MFITHDLRAVYCFYCRANYVVMATVLHNFQNTRVIWLFYHFFKLQVHILHGLENISIFNIWKLRFVICDVILSETSLFPPKISEGDSPLVIPWLDFKAYDKFYWTFEREIQIWPKVLVKKVTMQCTKVKIHTDACYPRKINKTNHFSPILVTSIHKTDSFLL